MADKRDYYEVLGISKTATPEEIKKAFRTTAKKYHPDMHPDDPECEEKFKECQEAYAVLSDEEKRRQYDQYGFAAFDGSMGAGGGGFEYSNMDFSDIFGDMFGDFFGGGGRRTQSNGPMKGANVRVSVRLTFEEAIFGCSKELEFNYKEVCKTCNGTKARAGSSPETCPKCGGKGKVVYSQNSLFGMVQNVQTCPTCQGEGKIVKDKCPDCRGTGYNTRKQRKTVDIPAGVDDGMSMRVRDFGEPGRNGGPRGDLLVDISVSRSPIFERQDMNIFSTVNISYAQAVLGGEIRIKTVDGEVVANIAPGTQSGTQIRLKGKGVPSTRNKNVRGDHYVTYVIQTPTNLSKEAKEALRRFDELSGNSLGSPVNNDKKTDRNNNSKKKKGFMDKLRESVEEYDEYSNFMNE